jgi:hypothetical protein
MAAPFCNALVGTHMAYGALFGFFSGGYVGLTSILVVDLVGVDKLSDAFGTLLLFQGVAVAIGTPICGKTKMIYPQIAFHCLSFLFQALCVITSLVLSDLIYGHT